MDVEFADPTYTVKELKAKIARIGLKLPARRIQTMFGSGKDGRLVKKDGLASLLRFFAHRCFVVPVCRLRTCKTSARRERSLECRVVGLAKKSRKSG